MKFLLPALPALLLLGGCVTPPPPYRPPAAATKPGDVKTGKFWWGTSTATFQNEDRGVMPDSPYYFKTDWDIFAEEGHVPPRGEDATFSWTHFDKDVAVLKKLGMSHYRFGVEWARVEPQKGVYNETAIRQYAGMARKLRAAGIEPVVTLWHFTFPSWLYSEKEKRQSNFLHPEVEERWRLFVTKVVDAMGSDVRIYVPQNEPNGDLQIGYIGAHWPPGLLLATGSYKKAMDAAVTMYRDAAAIVKARRPDALIVGIYSIPDWRRDRVADPTALVYNIMQRQNYDHLDRVADVTDIIGVNYYYSQDASIARFIYRPVGERSSDYTQNGWEIRPEGFYNVLHQVWNRYHKPILITENGIGTQSEQKKIRYIREHINQMRRAMADGIDIRGYFPWTLIDNYEWAEGFGANFGLTHVDPKTKERILEPSGVWFGKFIAKYPEP